MPNPRAFSADDPRRGRDEAVHHDLDVMALDAPTRRSRQTSISIRRGGADPTLLGALKPLE